MSRRAPIVWKLPKHFRCEFDSTWRRITRAEVAIQRRMQKLIVAAAEKDVTAEGFRRRMEVWMKLRYPEPNYVTKWARAWRVVTSDRL